MITLNLPINMDYIENIFENSKVIGNIYQNPELLKK